MRALDRVLELKRNLLVFAAAELPEAQLEKRIDIWWRAKENGSLMLTLAHLLNDAPRFRDHPIRVLRIIENEAGREQAATGMRQLLTDSRIHADVDLIVSKEAPLGIIASTSETSAVCFIGLALQPLEEQGPSRRACVRVLIGRAVHSRTIRFSAAHPGPSKVAGRPVVSYDRHRWMMTFMSQLTTCKSARSK